ncbi:LysR family transcriptional regulator [Lacticaseibacillus sp. N501-2]|uniref:LysR family transcriptional regulator n=1 Tax=Lacticaseibacillus salsurae TaxID=3367729 RepID=UPI0038B2A0C0
MDIRKLATFVDLASTLNYTETASRLFTTQATISKQIKSLEVELDTVLVDRSHRAIKLTAAGELALPYAQQIVAAKKQMTAQLHQQAVQLGMRLVVRAVPSISSYKGFNTIAAFTKQHPEVDLLFTEAETATLLPGLEHGDSDVIFTRVFAPQTSRYDVIIGESDHFVALLPKNHPLATAKSVPVAALAHDQLLLLSESTGLYQPVVDMLDRAKVTPKITYTGQRIDLIAGMVNRGMGVAIMMARSVDLHDYANVVAVPITPTVVSHLAFMRLHGKHTVASDLFWAFCEKHA